MTCINSHSHIHTYTYMFDIYIHINNFFLFPGGQLQLSQENERINMVKCNTTRLIYAYAHKFNKFPRDLNLQLFDRVFYLISLRQYDLAYKQEPHFAGFIFNVMAKCAINVAKRNH